MYACMPKGLFTQAVIFATVDTQFIMIGSNLIEQCCATRRDTKITVCKKRP
jgi:hypothetical protein